MLRWPQLIHESVQQLLCKGCMASLALHNPKFEAVILNFLCAIFHNLSSSGSLNIFLLCVNKAPYKLQVISVEGCVVGVGDKVVEAAAPVR